MRRRISKWLGSVLVVGVSLVVSLGTATATVLTFDDIATPTPGIGAPMPFGYGGFNWGLMFFLNTPFYRWWEKDGFKNGTVSGPNVAYNYGGSQAVVSDADGIFDFNGAYFTGAWKDALQITVEGYLDGLLKNSQTVVASVYSPTYFAFNFRGVDTLKISSSGGTMVYGFGTQFAMDNFTFNEPVSTVPEPGTLPLLGGGILGLVALRRRLFSFLRIFDSSRV